MKVCITVADGGHLTEMLLLMEAFQGEETFFITYEGIRSTELKNHFKVYTIPNFIGHSFSFVLNFTKMIYILLWERPSVLVSTGSEIAIPLFYFAWAMGIRTIFIETLARIRRPSFTGKMVYPISNLFLVQWEELARVYGKKAKYWGNVL